MEILIWFSVLCVLFTVLFALAVICGLLVSAFLTHRSIIGLIRAAIYCGISGFWHNMRDVSA